MREWEQMAHHAQTRRRSFGFGGFDFKISIDFSNELYDKVFSIHCLGSFFIFHKNKIKNEVLFFSFNVKYYVIDPSEEKVQC